LQLFFLLSAEKIELPLQVTGLPTVSVISAGKVTAPIFLMTEFKNEAKWCHLKAFFLQLATFIVAYLLSAQLFCIFMTQNDFAGSHMCRHLFRRMLLLGLQR
jgi:hypothetical protein